MEVSLPGQRVAQKMALRFRDHLRQRQEPKGRLVEWQRYRKTHGDCRMTQPNLEFRCRNSV